LLTWKIHRAIKSKQPGSSYGLLEKILSLSTVVKQLDDHISSRFGGYKALYAKDFVIYGSYSILRRWLTSDHPESPEQISDIILELVDMYLISDESFLG